MAIYYVSTSSGGTNAGTIANPYTSLATLNGVTKNPGDRVRFKRDDVFPGLLDVTDSGSSGNPIVFEDYGAGALPIISGGITLSSWTSVGGGIYEATCPVRPAIVTIGGVNYAPGRFPNTGWLNADSVSSNHVTSSGLTGQTGLVNAEIVTRAGRFTMNKDTITSQSGNTLGFANDIDVNYGFFLTHKASFLDDYGDWFWKSSTGKLQVYFGGAGTSDAIVSNLNRVMQANAQSYLTFTNISFRYGQATISNAMCRLDDTDHIIFDGCEFRYAGKTALLCFGDGNTNLTINNCDIQDINTTGIQIYGGISNAGLIVTNNRFNNIGMIPGEGENGEYVGLALQNENCTNALIQYNTFNNIGYHGMVVNGQNMLVKNNYINNFCYYLDDGGGIYCQDNSGTTGKRITENICLNGGLHAGEGTDAPSSNQAYGVYCDAFTTQLEIDHNTCAFNGEGQIYMDDSQNINIHHNNCFGGLLGITVEYQAHVPETPITGLDVQNNVVVITDGSSRVAKFHNYGDGTTAMDGWGTINHNIWSRPGNDTDIMSGGITGGTYTTRTLAQWRTATGYDLLSTGTPVGLDNPSHVILKYNNTLSSGAQSLDGVYIDGLGNTFDSSVTLAPFASKILFRTGDSSLTSKSYPLVRKLLKRGFFFK